MFLIHFYNFQYMPASDRCEDRLLATLENPSTVELLLNTMFGSPTNDSSSSSSCEKHCPTESVLVNGISVLLALLENRKAVNLTDPVAGEPAKVVLPNHYDAGATYGAGESRYVLKDSYCPDFRAFKKRICSKSRFPDFIDIYR